jgi:hypothetical protein
MNPDLIKKLQASYGLAGLRHEMSPGAQAALEFAKMRRQLAMPQHDLLKQLDLINGQTMALRDVLRQHAALRSVPRLQDMLGKSANAAMAEDLMATYRRLEPLRMAREALAQTANFAIPASSALAAYVSDFQDQRSDLFSRVNSLSTALASVQHLAKDLRTPWLDLNNANSSIAGLFELQRLGHAASILNPFDRSTSEHIREILGDWREEIELPEAAYQDAGDRADLYVDRGLDPEIIGFPEPVFDQLTEATGLTIETKALFTLFDIPSDMLHAVGDEFTLGRAEVAYRALLRFELCLRRFIHAVMVREFGEDWPRQRLPSQTYEAWGKKKAQGDVDGQSDSPLIDFADFSDYLKIIDMHDNWSKVFKPLFHRKEDVLESLRRLGPLRIATMHARPIAIGNADLAMLYSETSRMFRVMRVHLGRQR